MAFRKFFAAFIAFLQTIFIGMGLMKPTRYNTDVNPFIENQTITLSEKDESTFGDTIEYAANVRNRVQCVYADSARSAYTMQNTKGSLTHTLTEVEKSATLKDSDGNVYIEDSFRSFYTNKVGTKYYFERSDEDARVNTIRLGIYYYECHVRDLERNGFKVDKGYHVYSDRMYMQYSLLSEKATDRFKGFGSEITIPADTVSSLVVKDAAGTHTKLKEIDESTVEYVAFDIENVGVCGFIIPSDGSVSSVTLKKSLGNYTLTVNAAVSGGINDYKEEGEYEQNKVTFGCRIYTDKTHDFSGIETAAYEERNPLQNITVEAGTANGSYIGYDAQRGTYTLTMDGTNFQYAYDNPNVTFEVPVTVTGDSINRVIYMRCFGTSGCLEAASLLDENETLLPIDVQVCKNFQGDGGEDFYSYKDYQYGDSYFPLTVKNNETVRFTLLNLYQQWGNYPLKQLSSIEYHTSYYHLSTGCTESNCIAPYFVGERDGWTLPDFRNCSGTMWATQPQFNSTGILKFVSYRDDAVKNTVYSELVGSRIDSVGQTYADITDTYKADSGKYTYTLRHAEMPQTDENRTYYTVDIRFSEDTAFENFKEDFDLFYYDGRFVRYNKANYLNENNTPVITTVDTEEDVKYYKLGNECPYFGFLDVTDDTEEQIEKCFGCNFALLVRDSQIIVGGEEKEIGFLFRESSTDSLSIGCLTLDAEEITFRAGDSITLQLVLLPWGIGTETTDYNVQCVRFDSCLHPLTVTAQTGTVVEDAIIPTVRAEGNEAEFTVTGGKNNNTVKVTGLTSMRKPVLYRWTDGAWNEVSLASAAGYDGYTMRVESDGTYTFSFVYNTEKTEDEIMWKVEAAHNS